jgi:hypothetical protein
VRGANFALQTDDFVGVGNFLQGSFRVCKSAELRWLGRARRPDPHDLDSLRSLFLDEDQVAVFNFDVFHVVGQLELIALFG